MRQVGFSHFRKNGSFVLTHRRRELNPDKGPGDLPVDERSDTIGRHFQNGVCLMKNRFNIKSERCLGPGPTDVTACLQFPTIFQKILTGLVPPLH